MTQSILGKQKAAFVRGPLLKLPDSEIEKIRRALIKGGLISP